MSLLKPASTLSSRRAIKGPPMIPFVTPPMQRTMHSWMKDPVEEAVAW